MLRCYRCLKILRGGGSTIVDNVGIACDGEVYQRDRREPDKLLESGQILSGSCFAQLDGAFASFAGRVLPRWSG